MNTRHTVTDSILGALTIAAIGEEVTGIYFAGHYPRPSASALGERVPSVDRVLATAAQQLTEYLEGLRRHFDLPTRLIGTERHRLVWERLRDIGFGDTVTYGELATELGDDLTAYEVGQIVGRNPVSIVVPCHRVVGKTGALTGYAGGLRNKRLLLALEEREPAAAGRLF